MAVTEGLRAVSGNPQIEINEIKAVRELAARLYGQADGRRHGFGYGGVIELDGTGMMFVGYYVDPPEAAPQKGAQTGRGIQPRRTKITLAGRSIEALVKQAAHLGIAGVLR